jgi:hypothetical protein
MHTFDDINVPRLDAVIPSPSQVPQGAQFVDAHRYCKHHTRGDQEEE